MFTVNLLATLLTALALVGATLAVVATRRLPVPTIDALSFAGYAAGVLLAIGLCVVIKFIWSIRPALTMALVMFVVGSSAWWWMPGLLLTELSFGASLALAIGMACGALCVALWYGLYRGTGASVINLITSISAFGLGVGAAAVLLVLSVFNGFEVVIGDMFGKFNASIKIEPARGKTFLVDSLPLDTIRAISGISAVSLTLEETAFFEYKESRAFGKIKGVDSAFTAVSGVDSTLIEGSFETERNTRSLGIVGLGLRNKLNVNVGSAFDAVQVYAAKRKTRGPLDKPFRVKTIYPQGTFAIQQDYDQKYMFTNLAVVQELLGLAGAASAVEIEVHPSANASAIADLLEQQLGPRYQVKDRFEQDADLLRLMNIEKWLSYVILSLVLLLISFNLIGGLWLIVLEKEGDIGILQAMGATSRQVRAIFLWVGALLSVLGVLIGVGLASLLYFLQTSFELITVPQGLVVSAYPIEMRSFDLLVVVGTVLVIGLLASLPAARRAGQVSTVS